MAAPTQPGTDNSGLPSGNLVFPSDLRSITSQNGQSYRIDIAAFTYKSSSPLDTLGETASNVAGRSASAIEDITGRFLPQLQGGAGNQLSVFTGHSASLLLPMKINDVQTLTWSQESIKAIADSYAYGVIRLTDIIRSPSGITVNPALFMMFHHPNFKSYDMTWQLIANNEQETETIANIVNFFKYESSPRSRGIYMEYPSIFRMKLYPEDKFTFKLKPAIVEAVAVDYTGPGFPSFQRNGAPVNVNLTVRFKEIEVWDKENWNQSALGN